MTSDTGPRFSFIIIVLNGMPFIEQALKSVYAAAHEIIVVEGAVEACRFAANADGSSTDGTVAAIRRFPDPEGKLRLVQGLWPEKLDMHNRALDLVTGDYLWLVDADEIHHEEDFEQVRSMLRKDPSISRIDFIGENFWKGFDYVFVSEHFFKSEAHFRRVFRYRPGTRFVSHRPPTLSDESGRVVDGLETRRLGIYPRHYSYVYWSQVYQKVELYHRYGWGKQWGVDLDEWFRDFFCKWSPENREELEQRFPVWTGDPDSRTVPFTGTHPQVMRDLVRCFDPQAAGEVAAVDEDECREVIGAPCFQRKVLRAWTHIQLDDPLQRRHDFIRDNLAGETAGFWNNHVALAFLATLLRPKSYLEVGVRTGGSMVQALHHGALQRAVAVDLWDGSYAGMPNTLKFSRQQLSSFQRKTGNRTSLRFVRGNSHRELKRLAARGERFDLITIDGDHTRTGAWEDLEDAIRLLSGRGAIVFDDIIHRSHRDLYSLCHRLKLKYPDFSVLLNTSQDNGCAIFLRGLDAWDLLARGKRLSNRNLRVAGEEPVVQEANLTSIAADSRFARGIAEVFSRLKPRRIIETGTFHGEGTTRVIATCLREQGRGDARFFSIECNRRNLARARANLARQGLLAYVDLVHGLSVPRRLLPSIEVIREKLVDSSDPDDIYIDHDPGMRTQLYFAETDFRTIPEDRLAHCLALCDGTPDFVLLDSGGHMGNIEFNYLLEQLSAPCCIALDDINHAKHRRSYRQMLNDPRFTLEIAEPEKFGFCLARFTPTAAGGPPPPLRLLWIRTDAIGDSLLSLEVLTRFRQEHPTAWVTVLCQEHVAELYTSNASVNEVITFDRCRAHEDPGYRQTIVGILRELHADLCITPVYSREEITDHFALGSLAPRRIAFDGDDCNIDPTRRLLHNRFYTDLVRTAGTGVCSERRRCELLLDALGLPGGELAWRFDLTADDEAFASGILQREGLDPQRTIVFFPGAKDAHRLSLAYGEALRDFCTRDGYAVVALGTGKDREVLWGNLAGRGMKVVDLCGKATLRQAAAIIARCAVAVGAETGLAHLAATVGTRHVVLLGGGHFGRFMPVAPTTTAAVLPLECFGCNWHCRYGEPYCITGVDSALLAAALRRAAATPAGRAAVIVPARSCWPDANGVPAWDESVLRQVDFPLDVTVVERDGSERVFSLPGRSRAAAEVLQNDPSDQEYRQLLAGYGLERSADSPGFRRFSPDRMVRGWLSDLARRLWGGWR